MVKALTGAVWHFMTTTTNTYCEFRRDALKRMSLATTTLWSLGETLKKRFKDLSAVSNEFGHGCDSMSHFGTEPTQGLFLRVDHYFSRFDRILSWEIYSLKRLADSTRASLLGKFPHGSTMLPGLPPKWHQKTHPRDEWLLQPLAPPYVGGRRGFGKPTEGAFEAFLKWHYWGPAWRRHSRPLGPSWGQGQVTPKKTTIGCFLWQEISPPFTRGVRPWIFFCRFSKIWLKKGL